MKKPARSVLRGRQVTHWSTIFATHRPLEDIPFSQARGNITGLERKFEDTFVQDTESSIPSWQCAVLRKFFRKWNAMPGRNLARARLDDREYKSKIRRAYPGYPEWLTPELLQAALSLPRFDFGRPDADRRLIYIYGLTPDFALVLAKTVYCHQRDALRDTIAKHVDLATSLRVYMPKLQMFVLEFHLPYLTLRETVLSGGNPNMNIDQLTKVWADVSYLQLECTQCEEHKGSCEHLIREAHVSIVICGKDEFKWAGWAFVNTPSDPTGGGDKEEGEDEAEGDEKYEEGEDDDEGPNEDYFATDGEGELVVDANETTWDPRRYWLQIIDSRVKLALKEWEWLVKNVENGVNAWKEVHSLELAKAPDDRDQYNTEELFDWTIKTMQILRKLRAHAKTTHQTWARFAAPNGDSRFFLDLQDPQSKRALTSLKGSFQQLSDLRQTLLRLDESCKESKDMLSMLLERENNRMTAKNQELTRHIHELTEKSNLISYDIQVLSRKSTKATIASQKAADDTSRSTRINVLVLCITTPLLLVLQYFGADRDIFAFRRTSTAFFISLLVSSVALSVLILILSYLEALLKTLWSRCASKKGRKDCT